MIKDARSTLAVVVVGLLVGGCASVMEERADRPGADGAAATVEVTNHNWQDVVVYAIHPSQRVRLGLVVSMATVQLRIPATALGGDGMLRLVADPIGSNRPFTTERILVDPGARIELNVANSLALSSYAVRSGGVR